METVTARLCVTAKTDPVLWSQLDGYGGVQMRQVACVVEERHPTGSPPGFVESLTLARLKEVIGVVFVENPGTQGGRPSVSVPARKRAAQAQRDWLFHNRWSQ